MTNLIHVRAHWNGLANPEFIPDTVFVWACGKIIFTSLCTHQKTSRISSGFPSTFDMLNAHIHYSMYYKHWTQLNRKTLDTQIFLLVSLFQLPFQLSRVCIYTHNTLVLGDWVQPTAVFCETHGPTCLLVVSEHNLFLVSFLPTAVCVTGKK